MDRFSIIYLKLNAREVKVMGELKAIIKEQIEEIDKCIKYSLSALNPEGAAKLIEAEAKLLEAASFLLVD